MYQHLNLLAVISPLLVCTFFNCPAPPHIKKHLRIPGILTLFILLWCPGILAGSMDDENTYEVWRINQDLPAGSEYEDPDGDGYVNFEEYAFGLDPDSAESQGANRITLSETGDPEFPYMGKLTLRNPRPADVFYQIFRSADAGEDNPYEDWEILCSQFKTNDWVIDEDCRIVEELTDSPDRVISLFFPADYDGLSIKCEVLNTDIYPEFSWDRMQLYLSPRKPNPSQDGIDEFTEDDLAFIASLAFTTGNNVMDITMGEHVAWPTVLPRILDHNPEHKSTFYLNGAIVTTGQTELYSDLSNEEMDLWSEMRNDWLLSKDRRYIDYRKSAAMQRQKDIVLAYQEENAHGIFIDALAKTASPPQHLIDPSDKSNFLGKYFEFLDFVRTELTGGIRIVNTKPYRESTPYYTGQAWTDEFYQSDEAVINAYFNSLYSEGWLNNEKNDLTKKMDWYIENWTGHGRLFLTNGPDIIPSDQESVFQLGVLLAIMGENSFFRFHSEWGAAFRYEVGGWKNPTYWEHLADKQLGKPLSDAVNEGNLYHREFQYARVSLDVETRKAMIEWLDEEGKVREAWPLDYEESKDAALSAITWPDKPGALEYWDGDTIPWFDPAVDSYRVKLPPGTKRVPALTAIPRNINAVITQQRALNLYGSERERTTTFRIWAENQYDSMEYSVLFEVERNADFIQQFNGPPFISEIVTNVRSWMSFVEIVNPGASTLDLSRYLFLKSELILPEDALRGIVPGLPAISDFYNRYRAYVPGYTFHEDSTTWFSNPGKLFKDNTVSTLVGPGGVFVMSSAAYDRDNFIPPEQWPDKLWRSSGAPSDPNPEGISVYETFSMVKRTAEALYLFRILNDSVLDGSKAVGDPDDYELMDVFADTLKDGVWVLAGDSIQSNGRWSVKRKPFIYRGVTAVGEGMGSHPDSSDWILLGHPDDVSSQDGLFEDIGQHAMHAVTQHVSTIRSDVYMVSEGSVNNQSIRGDLSLTTVEQFLGRMIKADTGQALLLLSGLDSSLKQASDSIAWNDTLLVRSADRINETKYILVDNPLDSNAVLVTANIPSGLDIHIEGDSGTITGVRYGDLLRNLADSVVVPAGAVLNILNGTGNLIPLRMLNYNTLYVDTRIGNDVYFEVIAEDRVTKITYHLEPKAQSNDAYVISTFYGVDQDSLVISGLADNTGVGLFFRNIEVVSGATARLLDERGVEKSGLWVSYDDELEVTSQDETKQVRYSIEFISEPEPYVNQAPDVSLAFNDTTILVGSTLLVSTMAVDDGWPDPPASLTYFWEVVSGISEQVTIISPDQPDTELIISEPGDYILRISVSDGEKISQSDISISVYTISDLRGTDEPEIRIYPNPVKDMISIELSEEPAEEFTLTIHELTGKIVLQRRLNNRYTNLQVAHLMPGIYFLELKNNTHIYTNRVHIIMKN